MRIVCPSCAANYDVPDSLLPAGRAVRCARCNGEWQPVTATAVRSDAPANLDESPPPSELLAAPDTVAAEAARTEPIAITRQPRPTAMDRLAANPAAPTPRYGLRVAWAASFALLALLVCGAYTWRADIMHAWPPSARMYAAFGLRADASQTR